MRRRFLAFMSMIVMAACLAACGGSGGGSVSSSMNESMSMDAGFMSGSEGYYGSDTKGDYDYETGEVSDIAADRESTEAYLASRKLVYTAYVSAETKEYDVFLEWLGGQVAAVAGYVESMSEDQNSHHVSGYSMPYYDPDGLDYGRDYYQTRYANFTIRVPAKRLDAFLDAVGGNCNITSRSTDSEDVTLTYVDVQGRISSLESQVARLEELASQAGDLSDLITLESRIAEVRGELESYQSRLRTFDNQIDLATVNLNISEVVEFTENQGLPEGYLGQLWAAFRHGLQEFKYNFVLFTFWFAENLIGLIFWIAVIVVIVRFRRKRGGSGSGAGNRPFGFRLRGRKPVENTEPVAADYVCVDDDKSDDSKS